MRVEKLTGAEVNVGWIVASIPRSGRVVAVNRASVDEATTLPNCVGKWSVVRGRALIRVVGGQNRASALARRVAAHGTAEDGRSVRAI